jgi:hypothetical protein
MKYPELRELFHSDPRSYQRLWRRANAARRREQARQWRACNIDKTRRYDREWKTNHRIQNKEWLKEYLKVDQLSCQRCGYNKNFGCIDGHHKEPSEKESRTDCLGRWLNLSFKKFQDKIMNTPIILLCRNCHGELHAGDWAIEELA